jgi:hypothetical protein
VGGEHPGGAESGLEVTPPVAIMSPSKIQRRKLSLESVYFNGVSLRTATYVGSSTSQRKERVTAQRNSYLFPHLVSYTPVVMINVLLLP